GVAQRLDEARHVVEGADRGQCGDGAATCLGLGLAEGLECSVARHLRRRNRRDQQDEQDSGAAAQLHGANASFAWVAARPGWRPPPGMMMRPSTTAAPMPWRGVGIGVFAIHRLVAASYISVALKMRSGASPPKTRMRSLSAAAARPPRADGSEGATRQLSVAG